MQWSKRVAWAGGILVGLLSAVVYLLSMQRSVPFWDSGEFIAVATILGIPHPPGTPFYVMLGRIATLLPFGSIAERVNGLSAIASALAVVMTYFTTLRLIRLAQGTERKASDEWLAVIGATVGALLLAFSDSFWENATEAEVYSLMSLAQILVFWLGLKWWEAHEKRPLAGPLLMCVYLMWLCVGLHLGVGMLALPLLVMMWLVDRRAALMFGTPVLSALLAPYGLERMAGGIIGLFTIQFIIFAYQRKLNGWLVGAAALAAGIAMTVALGDSEFTPGTAFLALASVVVPLVLLARRHHEGRILALALFLMVAGYSTHLYLPIRAAQHPAINEGDPSNWSRLKDQLERKQYGQTSMFVRRGKVVETQLNKEFWRYFSRQWPLFPGDRLWTVILPLGLGIMGLVWQSRRDRTGFASTGTMFLFSTAGMILFLNFSDSEVRDRDYFFTTGYHWYALWIGMGSAWLMAWVRDSFEAEGAQRVGLAACGAILLAQPVLLARNLWFTHDRSHNFVAHDYAYNMLATLAPNSFIYTNGDNDTFPLWYIQQVEGFRKDVRIVNMSLLNTDWYIFQLRDEEPKVPITLDDATVRLLGPGAVQDENGNILMTNKIMIGHIHEANRAADGGWKKQPYFAVTVPEHGGLDKYFTLEGLVYRVNPDTLGPRADEAKMRQALYETFKYRGLFTADGRWDSTVYKDENASTLTRNYAAAHLELAQLAQQRGDHAESVAELERVERMFPDIVEVMIPLGRFYLDGGDTLRATRLFERMAVRHPMLPDAHYYLGVGRMLQGDLRGALAEFNRAIDLDRGYFYAYLGAYSMLWESGQTEPALQYLQRWLAIRPDDEQVRALYDGHMRQLGRAPSANAPPLPPPQLP
ncbi:MAG: DUF2723 domain-containing protein [Candidatus Eisenbacteria bacterium]|uniref:DUF2723 domain-containing protein n=1 Tax=Eiseniibacteriota bacterium TaxID=2212470 RepID=A0A849SRB8_UNCEI|nr:DUF2723 domain-containing protein [Candidatus Eisenbacteria bacterium]